MALNSRKHNRLLKSGDMVMVIAGGNKTTRVLKGQVGKIIRFVGNEGERAIVEGLNMVTHHERAQGAGKPGGRIQREAGIHVSNLMYFAEKLKKPVALTRKQLESGKRVRGYVNPESKSFEQIDLK